MIFKKKIFQLNLGFSPKDYLLFTGKNNALSNLKFKKIPSQLRINFDKDYSRCTKYIMFIFPVCVIKTHSTE